MSEVTTAGRKNRPSWTYPKRASGAVTPMDNLEMLESCRNTMEQVRDELRKLNQLFGCSNFLQMPHDVRKIRNRLTRKRRKKNSPKAST